MAKQTINLGSTANDGTGDGLRTAFGKVNSNFTELYDGMPTTLNSLTDVVIASPTSGQVLKYNGTNWVNSTDLQITSTNWTDITNKPTFATVATSGSYLDLTNKPTIPSNLDSLTDVSITNASNGQVLKFNGTSWVNSTDSTGGSGTANTGDITFEGIKVIGAGTASGDGNGYATLELVPDNNLYANHQYLVIDPTAPSHIHIRAGGTQDQSNAELYFGGERTNVRIADYSGVRLNRINNNFLASYSYAAPADFTLGRWFTESGNHYIEYTTANFTLSNHVFELGNNTENYVTVYWNNNNDAYTLRYGGSASDMGGGVFRAQVDTAPITGSQITIENMYWEFYQERTSYAEITSDFTVNVADDVRITGRDIFSLRNIAPDAPIEIRTDYDGADHGWYFNSDGNLQLPEGKRVNWGQNATTLAAPVANGLNDRLTLWDFQGGGSGFNYAIGVEGNHIWFTMDVNNKTGGFKFYSRDTEVFKIRDDGALVFQNTNKFNVVNVPTTSIGQSGDEVGYVAFNSTYMYYCTANYDGTTNIWKRVAWSNDTW